MMSHREAFGEAVRRIRTALWRGVCGAGGERVAAKDDREIRDAQRSVERKSRLTMTQRAEEMAQLPARLDPEAPGLIWVKGPHSEAMPPGLEAALKAAGYGIYCGPKAPGKDVHSSIIYWPNGEEDVGSEISRLRALSQDDPILALRGDVDPQLILTASQAGARGFVGIRRPSRIIRALSTAASSRGGKVVVARELLEALLVQRASREDCLAPHQQEILFEVATVAGSSGGELMFPRKLLEAFLVEVITA